MFFKKLFNRTTPAQTAAEALYFKLVEKARDPRFYTDLAVTDNVDGRFDMIVIHAMLVMRRLRAADELGRTVSQELFDFMFRDMDRSLRELGVGDLSVGKQIKKMALAFYGRANAYETGLDAAATGDGAALTAALEQTIYRDGRGAEAMASMIDYLTRADRHMQTQSAVSIAAGDVNLDVPVTRI